MDIKKRKELVAKVTEGFSESFDRLKASFSALCMHHNVDIGFVFDELTEGKMEELLPLRDSMISMLNVDSRILCSLPFQRIVDFCRATVHKVVIAKNGDLIGNCVDVWLPLLTFCIDKFGNIAFSSQAEILASISSFLASEYSNQSAKWKMTFLDFNRAILQLRCDSAILILDKIVLKLIEDIIRSETDVLSKIMSIKLAKARNECGLKQNYFTRELIKLCVKGNIYDRDVFLESCEYLTHSCLSKSPELTTLTIKLLNIGMKSRYSLVNQQCQSLLRSLESLVHPKMIIPKYEMVRQSFALVDEDQSSLSPPAALPLVSFSSENISYNILPQEYVLEKEQAKRQKIEISHSKAIEPENHMDPVHLKLNLIQEDGPISIVDAGPDSESDEQ